MRRPGKKFKLTHTYIFVSDAYVSLPREPPTDHCTHCVIFILFFFSFDQQHQHSFGGLLLYLSTPHTK